MSTSTTSTSTATPSREGTPFHTLTADEVCRELDVDPAVGLTDAEVQQRRNRYGANKLAEEAKEPGWKAFLRQYRDLMQLVLLGTAVVSIVALQDVSTGLVDHRPDRAQRDDGAATRRARPPRASPRCGRC